MWLVQIYWVPYPNSPNTAEQVLRPLKNNMLCNCQNAERSCYTLVILTRMVEREIERKYANNEPNNATEQYFIWNHFIYCGRRQISISIKYEFTKCGEIPHHRAKEGIYQEIYDETHTKKFNQPFSQPLKNFQNILWIINKSYDNISETAVYLIPLQTIPCIHWLNILANLVRLVSIPL